MPVDPDLLDAVMNQRVQASQAETADLEAKHALATHGGGGAAAAEAGAGRQASVLRGDEPAAARGELRGQVRQIREQPYREAAARLPSQAAQGAAMAQGAGRSIAEINQALTSGRTVSGPNPMAPIVGEYVEARGDAARRESEAMRDITLAEHGKQRAIAEQRKTSTQAYEAMLGEQRAKIEIQNDARADIMDAQKHVAAKIDEASKMLIDVPAVDPDRYFTSKSTGHRILMGIGAALMGAAGMDPSRQIAEAVRADIDAQKATIAGRQGAAQTRIAGLKQQQSIYANMLSELGDPRAAELATETAYLNYTKMKMAETIQSAGLTSLPAQAQLMGAQIDERQAEIHRELQSLAVATPERLHKQVGPTRAERRALERERDYQYKIRESGAEATLERSGGAGGEKAQAELIKRRRQVAKDLESVVSYKEASTALKDHLRSGGWSVGDVTTTELVRVAKEALGRMQSGGVIGPEEGEEFTEMLTAWGSDRMITQIERTDAIADSKIQNVMRGDPEAAAEYFGLSEGQRPGMGVSSSLSGVTGGEGYTVTPQK